MDKSCICFTDMKERDLFDNRRPLNYKKGTYNGVEQNFTKEETTKR